MKRPFLYLATIVLPVIFMGCGGGDDSNSSNQDTTSTNPTSKNGLFVGSYNAIYYSSNIDDSGASNETKVNVIESGGNGSVAYDSGTASESTYTYAVNSVGEYSITGNASIGGGLNSDGSVLVVTDTKDAFDTATPSGNKGFASNIIAIKQSATASLTGTYNFVWFQEDATERAYRGKLTFDNTANNGTFTEVDETKTPSETTSGTLTYDITETGLVTIYFTEGTEDIVVVKGGVKDDGSFLAAVSDTTSGKQVVVVAGKQATDATDSTNYYYVTSKRSNETAYFSTITVDTRFLDARKTFTNKLATETLASDPKKDNLGQTNFETTTATDGTYTATFPSAPSGNGTELGFMIEDKTLAAQVDADSSDGTIGLSVSLFHCNVTSSTVCSQE